MKNFDSLNTIWQTLVLEVITQTIPHSDLITGIRLVDKSNSSLELFRLEIWVSFNDEFTEEGKKVRDYLNTNYLANIKTKCSLKFNSHKETTQKAHARFTKSYAWLLQELIKILIYYTHL